MGVMVGMSRNAAEKQVLLIGRRIYAHSNGAVRLAQEWTPQSGEEAADVGACWWAWEEAWRGFGRDRMGPPGSEASKPGPDRVNMDNSEQKTASLLTSPLLAFSLAALQQTHAGQDFQTAPQVFPSSYGFVLHCSVKKRK